MTTTPPRPTDPKPRWQRRKDARPGEIVRAALDLFVEHGFAATRLEDVARRAGVTKGTMYLYFESKDALFKEAVRQSILPAIERGEELFERHEGSARELLVEFVRGWWEIFGSPPTSGIPKLVISESTHFPELARFYHEEVVQRGRRLFARVLRLGIERGEFRAVDVDYAVRVLSAPMLVGTLWRHSMAGCETAPFDFDRYLDIHIELMLHALLRQSGKDASDV